MNPIKSATKFAEKSRTKDFYSPAAKFGLIEGMFVKVTREPSPYAQHTKSGTISFTLNGGNNEH